jgi:hypothetical protein
VHETLHTLSLAIGIGYPIGCYGQANGMTLRTITLTALILLATAACGRRDNQGSTGSAVGDWWYGVERAETFEPAPEVFVSDNRVLVTTVDKVLAEEVPGGVILWAAGTPPTEGYWKSGLVQIEKETAQTGSLLFEFRVAPPPAGAPTGTAQTREIVEGIFLTTQDLEGIRQATVIGATNRRSTSNVVQRRY